MGHGKIPPFPIWCPLHLRNRSKTARSNTFKELEPGNTTIAENSHPNIPIPFYSVPYSRTNESISWLLIETGEPKRQHQVAKTICVPDYQSTQGQEWYIKPALYSHPRRWWLILLKDTITNGWPNSIKEVPTEIQACWMFLEELMIEDGLVLKGTWIVIPNNEHKQILILIHEGHLGPGKCKLWCIDMVYWLGINEQLEKLVLNCELCLKYSKANRLQTCH